MTSLAARPHQKAVIESLSNALNKLSTNHVGLTMPTGMGLQHTAALLLQTDLLRWATSAGRQDRPMEVVVVGMPALRDQFISMLPTNGTIDTFAVGVQMSYAQAVEESLIPRTWDLTVVLESHPNLKSQDWWYNHMSITLAPTHDMWARLHYHLDLVLVNPTKLQTVETTTLIPS